MAWYSVRLELREAADDAWGRLHKAMWANGFRRVITWKGKQYRLPTGSYVIKSAQTLSTIFNLAKTTAQAIDKKVLIWAVRFDACQPWLVQVTVDPDAPKKPAAPR